MSATDRVIAGAAGTTVIVLAGVAGAISYSHMIELARLLGELGWRVHTFPVSVDGIEIVASLVLLAHRRAGTPAGWLPWAALVAGTAASLAANVTVGASDPVGRLVAGWPAVALLVAIKLLSGLLDAGPHDRADPPDPDASPLGAGDPGPDGTVRTPRVPQVSGTGMVAPELGMAARTVRDELVASGTTVTRRSLAAGLRAAGHRVRNDRLGHLLAALNDEARAAEPVSIKDGGGLDA